MVRGVAVEIVLAAAFVSACSGLAGLTGGDDDESPPSPPAEDGAAPVDGGAEAPLDAAVDRGAPDVGPAGACDPSKPFGDATKVPGLNSINDEWSPRLSADQLSLYFASSRAGSVGPASIYFATRASTNDEFGNVMLLPGVNVNQTIVHPTVTGDGLTLYVQSDGPAQLGGNDLYVAVRATTVASFGALAPVANVNTVDGELTPFVTKDGKTLYFSSNRAGSYDIWRAVQVGGAFAAPTKVSEISLGTTGAEEREDFPVLTDDELTIYFARSKSQSQIFVARRSTKSAPFGTPELVTELDTPSFEAPSWISPDGCTLWFISNRAELVPVGLEMWRASRGK